MEVKYSKYLQDSEAQIQALVTKLSEVFTHVSILGKDVRGKNFSSSKNASKVSDYEFAGRGFVIRVYHHEGFLEYSLDNLELISSEDLIKQFELLGKLVEDKQYPTSSVEDEEASYDCFKEVEIDLDKIDVEKTTNTLKKYVLETCALDERIIDTFFSAELVEVSSIYVTSKTIKRQSYGFASAYCSVSAVNDDEYQSDYLALSGMKGAEIIAELDGLGEKCAKNTLELFRAEKIVPGIYDIITTPEVSGLIAHEAFGHGVEMDMFVKERALAKDYIGKEIASKVVNMCDGAADVEHVSSYAFDDEGVNASCTQIIRDGILESGIADYEAAIRLNVKPTGNGKRESFERKAYTRMTNTYFVPGKDKYEDMVRSITYGYQLEGVMSGMEDPKHWGIQCIVTRGREIKDGKFTGKVVSPVILTGYVPDLLKSITMVSDDFELDGGGYCGKGYKEWVKTSNGGPYLKAKARLG